MTHHHDLIHRMAAELDHYRQLVTDDRREVHPLAVEARAALSQPEPEVVGPMPSDQLVEQWVAEVWHEGTPVRVAASDLHLAAKAAEWGARWGRPAPAPAGEVGELVDLIRQISLAWEPDACLLGNMTAGQLTRAADLLEQQQYLMMLSAKEVESLLQRQAAPVPVASDVYFEFVVSDADYCTQAGGIAPSYAQAVDEGQNYLAQYQQEGPHTLEVRRVEVLPIPSVEAEE